MKFFEDYKSTLLVFITTLVFGYMLGLAISSVVDYRLRDAIINIPRPDNKIVLKLDDLEIKTNKVKEHFKNVYNKPKNIKESFQNGPNNLSKKIKKETKKMSKSVLKKTKNKIKKTKNKIKKTKKDNINILNDWDDPTLTKYSKNYKKQSERKNKKSFLNASNQEDTDQLYQSL